MAHFGWRCLGIACALAWHLTQPAWAQAPLVADAQVARVDLAGVTALDKGLVRQVIWTRGPRLPWSDPPPLDPAELDRDLERIKRLYADHGYPHADASRDIAYDERGRAHVVITVGEGQPVRVTGVEFTGFDGLTTDELTRLGERVPVTIGKPVVQREVVEGARLAIAALEDKGHAFARVNVDRHDNASGVRIQYQANPGPIAEFGPVTIIGNIRLSGDVIRREVTFDQGERYSPRELAATRREIGALGLVEAVQIGAIPPADASAPPVEAAIGIHVVEAEPVKVDYAFGYGTQDQLRGDIRWRHRNVAGGARTVELYGRWSSLDRGVRTSFLQPYFFSRRLALGLVAQVWHARELAFDALTQAGSVRAVGTFGISGEWAADLSTIRQDARLDEAFSGSGDSGVPAVDARQVGTLTLIGFSMSHRTATSDGRGITDVAVRIEQAGHVLPGSFQFINVFMEGRHIRSAGRFGLVSRLRTGSIDPAGPAGNIPLFKRYFAGGASSVRGWGHNEISPLSPTGLPVGGSTLLDGSVEWRAPLPRGLGGVMFVDAGNVWATPWRYDVGDLLYAAGLGFRYRSPLGPVGLDVGYQLTPRDSLQSIEGVPRRRWRVHLNVGETF